MDDAEPTYATLWPLGRTARRGRRAQAGLEKLSGARIALLWDHLFKSDEILRAFAERLGAQFADVEFIDHTHFVADFGDDYSGLGRPANSLMAEDEPSTRAIGWDPFRVDNGFAPEVSTASVLLITNHSAPIYTAGQVAEEHLETIARILANAIGPWAYTAAVHGGLVPMPIDPDWTSIVIGGNPGRNQSRAYVANLTAGPPVTQQIEV
jgi:hypothetical protein